MKNKSTEKTMSPRIRSLLFIAIIVATFVFAARPARCGTDAVLARGFNPNTSYQVNDFDAVNLFNGDLNVNVPIGPTYKTNGSLSYGFALHHNVDPWAYIQFSSIDTTSGTFTTDVVERVHVFGKEYKYLYAYSFSTDTTNSTDAGSEPVPTGNAGIGWDLDLGRFGAVALPEVYPSGTYTSPDGSMHVFYPSLHSTNYNYNGGATYTHDGSYLRLRYVGGNHNEKEVDFPDGTVKHFSCVDHCGQWQATWNLEWTSDPFGNVLLIERTDGLNPAEKRPTAGQWIWNLVEGTLPDGETRQDPYYHGTAGERSALRVVRQHRLTYDVFSNFPTYPWIGERLTKAELAGPHGDRSMVYTFEYAPKDIMRPPVLPWTGSGLLFPYNSGTHLTTVQTLKSMTLPEGAGQWKFDYYPGSSDDGDGVYYNWCLVPGGSCTAGQGYPGSKKGARLKSIRTPTGGGYLYDYALRGFPARPCVTQPRNAGGYGGGSVLAVKSRQQIDSDGSPVANAIWRYSGGGYFRTFIDENHDGWDDSDTNRDGVWEPTEPLLCRAPTEFLAASVDPNGLLTLGYYDVTFNDQWYGAPFTPRPDREDTVTRVDGSQTIRLLSSQTYQVALGADSPFSTDLGRAVKDLFPDYRGSDSATSATLLRSQYVTYEASAFESPTGDGNDWHQINLRLTGMHTRFDDDTATAGTINNNERSFVEVLYSDFDGLGHFRQKNTYGNLKAVSSMSSTASDWDHRIEYTFYNPDVSYQLQDNDVTGGPTSLQPWLLNLYTRSSALQKTGMASTHALFDPVRGYLRASRRLSNTGWSGNLSIAPASARNIDVTDSNNDALTIFTRQSGTSDDGFPSVIVHEANYGGDGQHTLCTASVPNGDCAWSADARTITTPPASEYAQNMTYLYGSLAKSDYEDCDGTKRLQTSSIDVDAGAGLPNSIVDLSGLTTTYQYDSLGRVITVTPPGNLTPQTYSYSVSSGGGSANELTITRSGGSTAKYDFDPMGRLTLESHVTPAGTATTSYVYNPTGKISQETLPLGGVVKHTYDVFDRETQTIGADHATTDIEYTSVREETSTIRNIAYGGMGAGHDAQVTKKWDSLGRLSEVNDEAAHAQHDYDALSNLYKITLNPAGDNNPSQVRRFDYDGRGVLISETHPELRRVAAGSQVIVKNQADSRGHVIARDYVWSDSTPSSLAKWSLRFIYDKAERLQRVTRYVSNGADIPLEELSYYDTTDVVGSRNRLNNTVRHNLYPGRSHTNGNGAYDVTDSYAYSSCNGTITDCNGLMTSSQMSVSSAGTVHQTVFSATVGYAYDNLGHLGRITYPAGYGAPGRMINYGYTADVLTSVTEGGTGIRRASLSYLLNGMPNTVQLAANGVHDDITAYANGLPRPRTITWNWSGGSATSDTYSYDGAGNISAIGADVYRYDKALRLLNSSVAGQPTETFTYDAFGNMTRGNGVDSLSNRLTTLGGRNISYDDSGNVTSMPDNRTFDPPRSNASLTFTYDALDAMIQEDGEGIGRAFVYDADGERVGVLSSLAAGGFQYLWSVRDQSHHVIQDVEQDISASGPVLSTWKKDYVYRGATLSNTISAGGVRDIHVDHLGSVRFVTDAAGHLVSGSTTSGFKFKPFGALAFAQPLAERFAFTGHERDDDGTIQGDADLDYMHARYYSAPLGRFLSKDHRMGAAARPQSWNRYAYASDDPIDLIDPDGQADIRTNCAQGKACELHAGEILRSHAGASNVTSQVRVVDATGQIRVYDHVIKNGDGSHISVEVKSGRATKTTPQMEFDARAGKNGEIVLATRARPELGEIGDTIKVTEAVEVGYDSAVAGSLLSKALGPLSIIPMLFDAWEYAQRERRNELLDQQIVKEYKKNPNDLGNQYRYMAAGHLIDM